CTRLASRSPPAESFRPIPRVKYRGAPRPLPAQSRGLRPSTWCSLPRTLRGRPLEPAEGPVDPFRWEALGTGPSVPTLRVSCRLVALLAASAQSNQPLAHRESRYPRSAWL